MSAPKRHHILPQFYMRRFTDDAGSFWVWDRALQSLESRKPAAVAARTHYYSAVDDDGNKDTGPEKDLALVEGYASPVFEKLDLGEPLEGQDRYYLSTFLGLLYYRLPAVARQMDEYYSGFTKVVIERNLEDPERAAVLLGADPEETRKLLESDDLLVKGNANMRIAPIFAAGPKLGKEFFLRSWTIGRAPSGTSFILSDAPISTLIDPQAPQPLKERTWGIVSPEVTTTVPISRKTCLLMQRAGPVTDDMVLSKRQVRAVNLATVREAERWAMARDQRHLRSLVRAGGLLSRKPTMKVVVENHPHPSGDPMRSVLITRTVRREQAGRKNS